MPRAFYHTDALYARRLRAIWYGGWLFAGFEIEIPTPGDFITLDGGRDVGPGHPRRRRQGCARSTTCAGIAARCCAARKPATCVRSSVRITAGRTRDRAISSHATACTTGSTSRSSASTGARRRRAQASSTFRSPSAARVRGLARSVRPAARPQGFDRAKIAKIVDYDVEANWKLVWENNRECFHCLRCHPQYVKANFDVYDEETASDAVRDEDGGGAIARTQTKWAAQGIAITHQRGGLARFPDPDRDIWYAADRTVMVDGWDTESMDGQRVAPLMGDYQDADVGVLRMRSMPNFWVHGSCDHAVASRLLPAGPRMTKVRSYWLVDRRRAGRRGLLDRAAAAVLEPHQRAGLGHLQVAAERRGFDRLRSGPAVAAEGIQRRRVHPLVPAADAAGGPGAAIRPLAESRATLPKRSLTLSRTKEEHDVEADADTIFRRSCWHRRNVQMDENVNRLPFIT